MRNALFNSASSSSSNRNEPSMAASVPGGPELLTSRKLAELADLML